MPCRCGYLWAKVTRVAIQSSNKEIAPAQLKIDPCTKTGRWAVDSTAVRVPQPRRRVTFQEEGLLARPEKNAYAPKGAITYEIKKP